MIIMMKEGATEKQVAKVTSTLEKAGCTFKIYQGGCIIAVIDGKPPSHDKLKAMPCVEDVTKTI